MASSSQQNPKPASDGTQPDPPLTRQEQEQATQDRTLAEFMLMLDDYEPLVRLPTLAARFEFAMTPTPSTFLRYPTK
jgi:hypothetical protein